MKYVLLAIFCSVAFGDGEIGKTFMPKGQGKDSAQTREIVKTYKKEVQEGRFAERTNLALNAIVRFAAFQLTLKGHKDEADKLIAEWESGFDGYLLRRDLGDHAPLSMWLAEKYAMIEFILGTEVCHFLRLDDIKTINYGIPVVFKCVDDVDVVEYGKHFIPLSGVAVYWSSFFACVGGTWGTGFLFCSPISMGAEWLTETWAAPRLNPTVHKWSCQ